jgi:DNA-binding MurR/RpiR family transcriptional regulator
MAMAAVLDIVAALHETAEAGGKSDRRVAAVVLADPDLVTHASIGTLAGRAGVSEPTVTRFCRSLGCEGMRDFKLRLARALAVGGRYLKPMDLSGDDTGRRLPDAIATMAGAAIEAVCRRVEVADLVRAAEAIAAARMVRAYGSGGSSSMAAAELESRLFRLGVPIAAATDGEMQRMTAAVADPRTVIVAFSLSGAVRPVVDAVAIARRYGARTIAFTAPGTALADAVEILFPFQIAEGANVLRPSPARYALLALVDMLAMTTAERIGAPAIEGMRRIKHHLRLTRRSNPELPLGDENGPAESDGQGRRRSSDHSIDN